MSCRPPSAAKCDGQRCCYDSRVYFEPLPVVLVQPWLRDWKSAELSCGGFSSMCVDRSSPLATLGMPGRPSTSAAMTSRERKGESTLAVRRRVAMLPTTVLLAGEGHSVTASLLPKWFSSDALGAKAMGLRWGAPPRSCGMLSHSPLANSNLLERGFSGSGCHSTTLLRRCSKFGGIWA